MRERFDDATACAPEGEGAGGVDRGGSAGCGDASHDSLRHASAEFHHHHSHASASHHDGGHHLLQVEGLSMSFSMYDPDDARFLRARKRLVLAIDDLSVSVHAGEVMAVVGASGSGKTLLADAVFALFEPNSDVRGTIWFDGRRCDARELSRLRGRGISLVPQSVAHLDPLMKVGRQVRGVARDAADARRRRRMQRALFERYGLGPEVEDMYPFELSGGMARRVLLCCALVDEPRLIVADEPTPGLDLDLAERALDDLRAFADDGGGVLLITHDIELALRVADRVAVFKDGTVVEETSVSSFRSPEGLRHPFTRELWHAVFGCEGEGVAGRAEGVRREGGDSEGIWDGVPSPAQTPSSSNESPDGAHGSRGARPASALRLASGAAASFAHRDDAAAAHADALEARGVAFSYPGGRVLFDGLDLRVLPGERVALSAPSGFGKTTLCRILAGYLTPDAGEVTVGGVALPEVGVRPVQLIGQHPETMVDPRMRMRKILEEAGCVRDEIVDGLGIRSSWMRRHPHELSGGELQRFCIARALAADPRYLVCDETTAMFDAVAQAEVWRFLMDYALRNGMGIVFVSHSPSLVERVATRAIKLA